MSFVHSRSSPKGKGGEAHHSTEWCAPKADNEAVKEGASPLHLEGGDLIQLRGIKSEFRGEWTGLSQPANRESVPLSTALLGLSP